MGVARSTMYATGVPAVALCTKRRCRGATASLHGQKPDLLEGDFALFEAHLFLVPGHAMDVPAACATADHSGGARVVLHRAIVVLARRTPAPCGSSDSVLMAGRSISGNSKGSRGESHQGAFLGWRPFRRWGSRCAGSGLESNGAACTLSSRRSCS